MQSLPVDLKGVGKGAPLKALGEDQLEDVAGLDVLLHQGHIVQELLPGHVGCIWRVGSQVQRQRHLHCTSPRPPSHTSVWLLTSLVQPVPANLACLSQLHVLRGQRLSVAATKVQLAIVISSFLVEVTWDDLKRMLTVCLAVHINGVDFQQVCLRSHTSAHSLPACLPSAWDEMSKEQ